MSMIGWKRPLTSEVGSLVLAPGAAARRILLGDVPGWLITMHGLAAGPVRSVELVELVVIRRALDDEGADHSVGDVDRGRAVLVRVIPVRAGRLTHLQRAGRRRVAAGVGRELITVRVGADIVLRPLARSCATFSLLARSLRAEQAHLRRRPGAGLRPGPERGAAGIGRAVPVLRPLGERIGRQVRRAFGEERVELLLVGVRPDRRPVVRVARRGPHLEQDVVGRAVGIGMRPVEMDVSGARSVEAVRVLVRARIDADHHVARRAVAAGFRGQGETGGIDLIDEGELDEAAQPGAQGGRRKRVRQRLPGARAAAASPAAREKRAPSAGCTHRPPRACRAPCRSRCRPGRSASS